MIMNKETTKTKSLTAEELDEKFDAGEDISEYLDYSKASRPGLKTMRFNIDVPAHFLEKLDREAEIRGLTRQALVKMWLYRAWQTEGTKS